MTRTLLIPTVFFVLMGVLFFGLTYTPAGRQDGAIVFASADDIKTLDPGKMSWQNDIRAAMGLWEGLTANDPKTLNPIPATAERWEISADGLTYTFHLRPDARWSNGDKVVAGDFVFAWQRVLTPATAGDYVTLFFHIEGAQKYYETMAAIAAGKWPATTIPSFNSVGISAPDAHTLVVKLAHPCTFFLDLTAFPPFYPLHQKAMAPFAPPTSFPFAGPPGAFGGSYDPRWTRPPHLVTNGPFRLAQWEFKRYLDLVPNEYYWDRGAVKCPRLRLVAYNDPRAGLLAYESGQVDAMSWVPDIFGPELLAQQASGKRSDVHWRGVFASYYYVVNCTRKPFDDARVRRALALVIDKDEIVKNVTRMGQRPINTFIPPEAFVNYQAPAGLSRNYVEAQRLLAEAGFAGGRGFPEFAILYNTESLAHGRIAQAVGQMWQQHLGLKVTYRGVERSSFGSERRGHNFAIARGGWTGDYPDPLTWLELARTGDGNNDGLYSNPAYDKLLQEAGAEVDAAKRYAILERAEKLLVEEDMPYIPLYQQSDGYIFDEKKIGGLDVNVRLLTQFKYIHRK